MKKTVTLKLENKIYELGYDIKQLSIFESLSGRSLISYFSAGSELEAVKRLNIRFTVSGLIAGMALESEDEAYDIIQEYCDNGGTLYQLNNIIGEAVQATGLFTVGRKTDEKKERTAQKKK